MPYRQYFGKRCHTFNYKMLNNLQTEHVLGRMKKYCREQGDTDLAVWYNGSSQQKMEYWLTAKAKGDNFMHFLQQPPGGLGEKLTEAALSGFRDNREYVVIIGNI